MDSATVRGVPTRSRAAAWNDGAKRSEQVSFKYVVRYCAPAGVTEVFQFQSGDLAGYVLEGAGVPKHVGAVALAPGAKWN